MPKLSNFVFPNDDCCSYFVVSQQTNNSDYQCTYNFLYETFHTTVFSLQPFVPNSPFLYPLKTSENFMPYVQAVFTEMFCEIIRNSEKSTFLTP